MHDQSIPLATMGEVQEKAAEPVRDPWVELEKIAREINPEMPVDLYGYEVRITLNREFQAVEYYLLENDHG